MEMYNFNILLVSYIAIFCVINGFSSTEARVKLSKSIEMKDGRIFDCIDINKQPAFDRPSLKNHKIQMEPTFILNNTSSSEDTIGTTDTYSTEDCPVGTVPIQRLSTEEQQRYNHSFNQMFNSQPNGLLFAGLSTKPHDYHGGGGIVSVYNPHVEKGQLSASVITVEGGPPNQTSFIRVGWMVNPSMYGDSRTHLYTMWGQGNNGVVIRGCMDTQCPGFVVVSRKIAQKLTFQHVSTPRGPQHYTKMKVIQVLFKHIRFGAPIVRMGGTVYSETPNLPPMGSGGSDCYFQQLTLEGLPATLEDAAIWPCYKLGRGPHNSFWFGGPGGDQTRCRA